MKPNKGFVNKAKSGTRALAARWRQAAEKARLQRLRAPKRRVR